MKKSEIITKYRTQIKEAMADRYHVVLDSNGSIQYGIYIWEDGEIEMLEGCTGDNTWLQPKSYESRKLYYITTVKAPFFNAFDFSDDPEPEDEDEKETARQQIVNWLVDEYMREGADDVLDTIINQEKLDEEDDWM